MKKLWIVLLSLLGTAAVFFLVWSLSGYILSEKRDLPVKLPEKLTSAAPGDPQVGALWVLHADFKLPRFRTVTKITAVPGKGTVLSRTAAARKVKRGWLYNHYRLECTVCGIRTGKSAPGSVTVEIAQRRRQETPEKFTLQIPSLQIKGLPVQDSPKPELAQEAAVSRKISPYWHFLWGLLLIPVILFLIFRKRRKEQKPVSLRRRTLDALDALQQEVLDRRLSAKEGMAGVSDLLRNYLEERFKLPVSRKTTPEFLAEMEFSSAIPSQAGSFLKKFLNAADMIKFAQAPCDAPAVSTAVASAVDLVENTSAAEEEKK